MKRLRNENPDLDAVDLQILRILAEDARTSVAEIARSVGMSAPSVSERIRRLQENGTIQAYTIRDRSGGVRPAAVGVAAHTAGARPAREGRGDLAGPSARSSAATA